MNKQEQTSPTLFQDFLRSLANKQANSSYMTAHAESYRADPKGQEFFDRIKPYSSPAVFPKA